MGTCTKKLQRRKNFFCVHHNANPISNYASENTHEKGTPREVVLGEQPSEHERNRTPPPPCRTTFVRGEKRCIKGLVCWVTSCVGLHKIKRAKK